MPRIRNPMVPAAIRNIVAAGAAALAVAFSGMDSNPSLFLYDKLFVSERRLNESFRGKTMWITGASSGIGADLAMKLSRCGVNLILSARASDKLQSVADSCRRVRNNCDNTISVVPFDLAASHEDLERAVDSALDILGKNNLDFVILNAGAGQLMPATKTSHLFTEQIFRVNTFAPIALTKLLLERGVLQPNKGRHLVVTSSVGGKFGLPLSSSYAASKHALHGYYDSLRAECPWLRIDLICPGPVDTSFHGAVPKDVGLDAKEAPVRELKMPVSRCTALIVSALLMKKGGEFWLTEQPTLLGMYIKQYFPNVFEKTLSKVGPMRVKAWEEGKNLYDPETWKAFGRSGRK